VWSVLILMPIAMCTQESTFMGFLYEVQSIIIIFWYYADAVNIGLFHI